MKVDSLKKSPFLYGFILFCGFGSLLCVGYLEITSRETFQTARLEIPGIQGTFLQDGFSSPVPVVNIQNIATTSKKGIRVSVSNNRKSVSGGWSKSQDDPQINISRSLRLGQGRASSTGASEEGKPSPEVELMKRRADFTRQSCKKLLTPIRLVPTYLTAKKILVDDKRKILFCYIPKVACSNWKRMFLGLQGVVPMEEVNEIPGMHVHSEMQQYLVFLSKFSPLEQIRNLKNYTKIMFVREPIDRLVSAYRNKLINHHTSDYFYFLDQVTKFYDKYEQFSFNRTGTRDLMQKGISFQMFLQYLVDQHKVGVRFNWHYDQYENICDPCNMKYDYIGEFDNLETEAVAIFQEFSINYRFPVRKNNSTGQKTVELVDEYIRSVPIDLFRTVLSIYKKDFSRYGYNSSKWLP